MKLLMVFLIAVGLVGHGCAQPQKTTDRVIESGCEDCDLMFDRIPETFSWETTIVDKEEPVEPLIISGTIFRKDGRTPAGDVILYFYHTDNKGYYSNPKVKGNRHGHLRGWVKTGADGRYRFTSIRPAPYPRREDPAHIHALVKEPGLGVYWIDDYLFDDDTLVTAKVKSRHQKRGGDGIIHLTKNDKGVWTGKRDLVLGLNIPGY